MQIIETTATPRDKKSVLDFLLGRPLSSDEDVKEQIRSSACVPVFERDALSSAGSGPEATLTILVPRASLELLTPFWFVVALRVRMDSTGVSEEQT